MIGGQSQPTGTLAEVDTAQIAEVLAGNGLWIDLGAAIMRVRCGVRALGPQLQATYRFYPFVQQAPWADLHIDLVRSPGIRRWVRRQVVLRCDGEQPFEPFPAGNALPLLEWGGNWLIARRMHDLLLLHAGAVEKGGRALLLPALPGSGKSTLTAALSLRGWRLLSDEFGAFDPAERVFRAILKPVALKNASIPLVRRFAPDACFGPEFPKTRKGTVAHLAASRQTVERRHESARPGAIVLPQWRAGSSTSIERVAPQAVFGALAFNAFNYKALGAVGFDAVVDLARTCPAWQLIYSDLDDAIAAIDGLWRQLP